MEDKIQTYRTIDTQGKSQIELILQVYDGALGSLRQAKEKYAAGENNAGYELLEKTKKFVTHLYTTLNMEEGGEIAENLAKLYAYVISQICILEATKESSQIDDIITILSELREGWQGIKDSDQAQEVSEKKSQKLFKNEISITG